MYASSGTNRLIIFLPLTYSTSQKWLWNKDGTYDVYYVVILFCILLSSPLLSSPLLSSLALSLPLSLSPSLSLSLSLSIKQVVVIGTDKGDREEEEVKKKQILNVEV